MLVRDRECFVEWLRVSINVTERVAQHNSLALLHRVSLKDADNVRQRNFVTIDLCNCEYHGLAVSVCEHYVLPLVQRVPLQNCLAFCDHLLERVWLPQQHFVRERNALADALCVRMLFWVSYALSFGTVERVSQPDSVAHAIVFAVALRFRECNAIAVDDWLVLWHCVEHPCTVP